MQQKDLAVIEEAGILSGEMFNGLKGLQQKLRHDFEVTQVYRSRWDEVCDAIS